MSLSDLTTDALQAESTALQRIARSLVDAHAAEDAAQDAWLAAQRRSPERGRSAWLAVVARNAALRRRRTDARRGRRERSAARAEAQPSAADAVARVEICGRVVEAVLALDEPYRTTVVMRFWDDLPPRLVAERMQVPVATVRTRTRRALEQLRDRLDRRCGGRAAWSTPLARWLEPSTSMGAAAIALMTSKLGVAALCCAALMIAWLAFARTDREPDAPDSAQLPDRPPANVGSVDRAPTALGVARPPRERAAPPGVPGADAVSPTILTGRLVDATGLPMRRREFRYSIRIVRGLDATARTDDRGRFHIELDPENTEFFVSTRPHLFMRVGDPEADFEARGPRWTTHRVLEPVEYGRNELGDVVLDEAPVIVAGRLVQNGVELGPTPLRLQARLGSWTGLFVPIERRGGGYFYARGHVPDVPLRLSVDRGPWQRVEPVGFTRGARDVEIELRPAGSVRATFALDDGPWRNLRFQLEATDGARDLPTSPRFPAQLRRAIHRALTEQRTATYTWEGLAPGSYRLAIETPGPGRPVVDLPGILVAGTGVAVDPRLDAIDLRGLPDITVRVADAGGQPCSEGGILVASPRGGWSHFELREGQLRLPIVDPVDLWAYSPRHRSRRFDAVHADTEVLLMPAEPIEFRVAPRPDLPNGTQLRLTLRGPRVVANERPWYHEVRDTRRAPALLGAQPVDLAISPDGSARHALRLTGEVTCELEVHAVGRSVAIPTEPRHLQEPFPREVTLQVDPAALREALEQLGKQPNP